MSSALWMSDLIWQQSSGNRTTMRVAITMVEIDRLRQWLLNDHGLTTRLVIERTGDRNRVFLRFVLPHGTGDIEAGWLRDLRKKSLNRSQARLHLERKLLDREGERADVA